MPTSSEVPDEKESAPVTEGAVSPTSETLALESVSGTAESVAPGPVSPSAQTVMLPGAAAQERTAGSSVRPSEQAARAPTILQDSQAVLAAAAHAPTIIQDSSRLLRTDTGAETLIDPGSGAVPVRQSELAAVFGSGDHEPAWEPKPGLRFGKFDLLSELGRGGMGVVFLAVQVDMDREVAIKVLSPSLGDSAGGRSRFQREVELAGKLRHPGIVSVFDYGEYRGYPYFSMPFIKGKPLSDCVVRGGMDPREAAKLIEKIANAVDYAHGMGVVHRDLKPLNILIDGYGEPLVADFGLAKDLASHSGGLTRTGEILGTPAYMSPEQAEGLTNSDHRVDVHALGVILYELLSGRIPYDGETAQAIIMQVLTVDAVPLRKVRTEIPKDLETICAKSMEKDPAFRYQSAGALADDLSAYLDYRPISARPPTPIDRVGKWIRKHRSVSWTLAGAVLAIMIAILATWLSTSSAETYKLLRSSLATLEEAKAARVPGERRRLLLKARQVVHVALGLRPNDLIIASRAADQLAAQGRLALELGDDVLAESAFRDAYEGSGSEEHKKLWRRLRSRVTVSIRKEEPDAEVRLVPWSLSKGRIDAARSLELRGAALDAGSVELPFGAYVGIYESASGRYRFSLDLRRGEDLSLSLPKRPRLPRGMIFVPGATFTVGREDGDPDERPREVTVPPFAIDELEVSVELYQRFLQAVQGKTSHDFLHPDLAPSIKPDKHVPNDWAEQLREPKNPVVGVDWYDAWSFARWARKRLPSEEEWELAAGGIDGRRYPWGDTQSLTRANFNRGMVPVGSYEGDLSPYGCRDMAGNADEWCRSIAGGSDSGQRVLRGGVWYFNRREGGCVADRSYARATERFPDTGFRCALGLGGSITSRGLNEQAVPDTGRRVKLRVAAWPNYAHKDLIARFAARHKRRTGVSVELEVAVTVSTNDEFRKLARRDDIHLIAPSCDMAPLLIREGLILEIANRGAFSELIPAMQLPPFLQVGGASYGVPYTFGPMWLGMVPSPELGDTRDVSWRRLWSPKLKGRIALWDDAVWAISVAALELGLGPLHDLSDAELKQVEAHLDALLANGCRLWSKPEEVLAWINEPQGVLLFDDWGILGRRLRRSRKRPQLRIPREGSTLWIDSWMITRACTDSRTYEAARAWIEYSVSAENQRDLHELTGYYPTNARAIRLLDKAEARQLLGSLRLDDSARFENLVRWRPVPRREVYRKLWQRVKLKAKVQATKPPKRR